MIESGVQLWRRAEVRRIDLGVLGLLIAIAALVQVPYLRDAPRFRDETFNALLALEIFRGEIAPLTDIELYMGSFYVYVVAGVLHLIGPTIYAARLVVTAFGIATVGAAYLLGRELGGRVVGVITAILLLTNGIHIAAIGHVGFSAHISPFFTTVGFWLLHRAVVRQGGKTLALAGFFFGMGLHTHPTTVAYLPGVLGWFLWTGGRRWLRTLWPYVAVGAFLIAYSPMIVYNMQTGGESIRHALYTATERPDYALGRETTLTPEVYLERQRDFWMMIYRTVGGALDERRRAGEYLSDPVLVVTAAYAVISVIWAARRGYALPIWAMASLSLILPLFNANHYDVVGDANYVVKVLPLVYACMAWLTVALASNVRGVVAKPYRAYGMAALACVVVLVQSGYSLRLLADYYRTALRAEPTNASLIAAVEEIKSRRQPTEIVVLDNRLNERRVEHASPWDEESSFRVMRFIMEYESIPYEVQDVDDEALDVLAARGSPVVLIVTSGQSSRDTDRVEQLIAQYELRTLDGHEARPPRPDDRYAILRMVPG